MSDEYWIHEDGDVEFADGDVGDMNHEGMVIDTVQKLIMDKCENIFDIKNSWGRSYSEDEYANWDEFLPALASAYAEEYIHKFPERERKINRILENDPEKLYMPALKQAGVKQPEFDCANGRGDARVYAMMYWKWKTYRDGNIDTWTFNKGDLQAIISGIESIANDAGWSDKALDRIRFNITVFSSKKHFSLSYKQMLNPRQPSSHQNPMYDYLTAQAEKQVKDIELQKMHPAYKRPGVNPFGDATIHSFKLWSEVQGLSESLYHRGINPHGKNIEGDINVMIDYIEENDAREPYNVGVIFEDISKTIRQYSKAWRTTRSIKAVNPSFEEGPPHEQEEHDQYRREYANQLRYLADEFSMAADKAYRGNNDPDEAKWHVVRAIQYIQRTIYSLQNQQPRFVQKNKIVANTKDMLLSYQESLNRIMELVKRWGRSNDVLPGRSQPQNADPVRVYDSQYMTGGVPYLDGIIAFTDRQRQGYVVKYPDGRTEQITGIRHGDTSRIKWNRGEQRWDFK